MYCQLSICAHNNKISCQYILLCEDNKQLLFIYLFIYLFKCYSIQWPGMGNHHPQPAEAWKKQLPPAGRSCETGQLPPDTTREKPATDDQVVQDLHPVINPPHPPTREQDWSATSGWGHGSLPVHRLKPEEAVDLEVGSHWREVVPVVIQNPVFWFWRGKEICPESCRPDFHHHPCGEASAW